ncbi:MAG: BA14K family protein [Casimicrobiaceae bacterium]
MKRKPILIVAATAALCALPLAVAQAQGSSHGGGHGGGGGGGAMHGGSPGGSHGGGSHGGWHGGGPHGGHWHGGGGWHGGYGGFGGPYWNFYLGAPWYPSLAWGYPGYYPYDDGGASDYYDNPAPAYWGPSGPAPAPSMNAAPSAPPTQFRYYCPDGGYYPSVRTCPKGWVQMPGNPGQAPAAG